MSESTTRQPMTYGEFCAARGWPAAADEDTTQDGVCIQHADGSAEWVPNEAREARTP